MTTTHPLAEAYATAANASNIDALVPLFAADAVLQHPLSGKLIGGFKWGRRRSGGWCSSSGRGGRR